MVRLKVGKILEMKGKSKYWLWKRQELDGMSYQNLNALINNSTKKISFETLDKLSKALDVPVSELFEQTDEIPG